MFFSRLPLLAAAALTAAALPAAAFAQSAVVIWPVDPVIGGQAQAAALWLENRGPQPVTMQIRALGWQQDAGEDRMSPQDAVVSSPPIAVIAPGERQLVRLIRRQPDTEGERAYRLLIDELPSAAKPQAAANEARLNVQMRYSIPLFTYAGDAAPAPELSARIRTIAGKRWLEISNRGAGHARLTNLGVTGADGLHRLRDGLAGYVLASASMRWPLPSDLAAAQHVKLHVNGSEETLTPAQSS